MLAFHRVEVKEQLAASRAVRLEELASQESFGLVVSQLEARVDSLRLAADQLVGLGAAHCQSVVKKRLANDLRELNEVLLAKGEVATSLTPTFASVLPVLEAILHFGTAETGLVGSCLSILETITYQLASSSITDQILGACLRYIGLLVETANPAVCVAYAVNFSNILGNSLMSHEELAEIDLGLLTRYLSWLLNLMRLKKSADFARNSIWLLRALILRFSKHNPRNIGSSGAICQQFEHFLQHEFSLAEACSLGLDYYCQKPVDHQSLLVEVLWTLAFSAKHSPLNQSIFDRQLFCKLTELVLGNDTAYAKENMMLPYLSYLGCLVATRQSQGMLQMVGGDNMKIFNQLTAILQLNSISKATTREAMYVVCCYMGSGVNFQLAEITVMALSRLRDITEDAYFDKEMFFIHLTFLKLCLADGRVDGETFAYAKQVARQKLARAVLSSEEMSETNTAFDVVLKYLRSKEGLI